MKSIFSAQAYKQTFSMLVTTSLRTEKNYIYLQFNYQELKYNLFY